MGGNGFYSRLVHIPIPQLDQDVPVAALPKSAMTPQDLARELEDVELLQVLVKVLLEKGNRLVPAVR